MSKLKALIVDDEYPARAELRYLLNQLDNVEVIGEATNAQEALSLIKAIEYSVVFMDIQMPGMSGMELGSVIRDLPNPPKVVFVSAYDEYGVQAFAVDAVDYLVKPVDEKRLAQAVNKVEKLMVEKKLVVPTNLEDLGRVGIGRIPAEKQGRTILVNESEIIYAMTENEYVYIRTYDDKLFTRFTLKELESRLSPSMFFRTHRCYIVNLHKVKELYHFFNGTYTLIVEDKAKSEVPVSRTQAKKLRKLLGM